MALSMAACGSSQAPGVSGPPTFSGPAEESVTSDSGQLSIAVRWWPVVPVQGNDAAELTIVDVQGAPVDGLMMSIVPWMPAHGHGTAIQPTVTSTATGVLMADPLYLFMAGEWQLRMTISGTVEDSAIATVEIP